MVLSINTNTAAVTAATNLLNSRQSISASWSRLSSSRRIYSGDDDASIATQMQNAVKAANDKADTELKAQGKEIKDTVTLQQHAKAENAAAEQSRIDVTDAKKNIKDAAQATELAQFAQAQIRQQAGTSMLMQGSSITSQAALSLLRG